MRFIMLMIPKGYERAKPDATPDAAAVAKMTKYNNELEKADALISFDGFQPPSTGARVAFIGGKPKVTNGPFEAKETVGGYWIIEAKSKEEAINWATRCPASEGDQIEVRQMHEISDFPIEVQRAAARDSDLRGRLAKKSA